MSAYAVCTKRSAEKETDEVPGGVFDRVANAILQLEENPRRRGVKKLRGAEEYRLRVGAYRVLYSIDDEKRLLEVMAVGHRGDVHRGR